MDDPRSASKVYRVGDREYTLRPWGFFDILALPTVFSRILDKLPSDRAASPADVIAAFRGDIHIIVAEQLGIPVDEMPLIPADVGLRMVSDFIEMNLTENFFDALGSLKRQSQELLTRWRKV